MTLANKITIFRIVLTPLIVIGMLSGRHFWPLFLFLVSAASDVADGAAARLRGEKTRLGSYLDPLADKVLLVFTFMTLAHLRLIPMWVFVLVFSRDLFILLGWNVIYILTQNSTPVPRWAGKICTFTQMLTVGFVLIEPLRPFAVYVLWPMVFFTVVSTLDYTWVGIQKLSHVG